MTQRDLVLLPYPFTDFQGTKVRPALIVSNNILNQKSEDCIMVALTTILKNEPYSLNITQSDLIEGKLIRPSRIRVDKIFSVKKSLVLKKIGVLSSDTFTKVKLEIGLLF